MANNEKAQSASGKSLGNTTDVLMGEAYTVISDEDLEDFKKRADQGDRESLRWIVDNYYGVNYGDNNSERIYWQIKAARFGYCEFWRDMMFAKVEEGLRIPQKFFRPGETLQSIGEASGCAPYVSIKARKNASIPPE